MPQITTKEASQILGISKRTLFRWEIEGRIKSTREGILNIRVYDRDYILETKKILELDKLEREIVAQLHEAVEREKQEIFMQDVDKLRAGEPMKFMDLEKAGKAMDDVDSLMKEHNRILDELYKFSRERLKELLLKKE